MIIARCIPVFSPSFLPMTHPQDFLARLDDLVVLRITGDDAASFLHTQLSNDIVGMSSEEARLAAYCTPKGRMLATLLVWRESSEPASPLLALTRADLLEPLLKRLRMFVLRARAVFEVTDLEVCGACVSASATVSGSDATPGAPATWAVERGEAFTRIAAPAVPGAPQRSWTVMPMGSNLQRPGHLAGLPELSKQAWNAQDIAAGLGWVESANVELFIPQSLNYDLIGGVSFTKGCYPGQEIVARAHFRGTVKRRAFPAYCHLPADASLQPGQDIHDAKRPATPAGRIINVATGTGAGEANGITHLLVELTTADIGQADFRVLTPQGPALQLLTLPYSLEVND